MDADATGAGTIVPVERFTCQATGAGDAMCAGIALALAENGSARGTVPSAACG